MLPLSSAAQRHPIFRNREIIRLIRKPRKYKEQQLEKEKDQKALSKESYVNLWEDFWDSTGCLVTGLLTDSYRRKFGI